MMRLKDTAASSLLRSPHGATQIICVIFSIVIVIAGACLYGLMRLVGGSGEVQNATDAGSLNMAKHALERPGVALNAGIEANNFSQYADRSGTDTYGQIDLVRYNRVVGQTLLVALNAAEDNSPQGLANAALLAQAVCEGDSSIGGRLRQALSSGSTMNPLFSEVALANSTRMANGNSESVHDDSNFQVSYMERTGATNVYVADGLSDLFPSSFLDERNGRKYLRGYLNLSGSQTGNIALMAIPLQPRQQPHLVSQTAFAGDAAQPTGPVVPPNAFRSQGQARVDSPQGGTNTLVGAACALTGVVSPDQEYELSLAGGYIEIVNPVGKDFSSPYGISPATFLTTGGQATSGIYVAKDSAGAPAAFSTNLALVDAWATYNSKVANGTAAGTAAPSLTGLYNALGDAATATDAAKITANKSTCGGPAGSMGGSPCGGMLNKFSRAYPGTVATVEASRSPVMAVEYHKPYCYWKRYEQESGSISPLTDMVTGLRKYREEKIYHYGTAPIGDGVGQISDPGTIKELLDQCQSTQILAALKRRIKMIKPSATAAEIDAVLNSDEKLELQHDAQGEFKMYIYMNQTTHNLVCTATKPSNYVASATPDGATMTEERAYPLLTEYINPPLDFDIHLQPWRSYPANPWLWTGHDRAVFKKSSGYNNLLGQLRFENQVSGQAGDGNGGMGAASDGSGSFSDFN